MDLLLSAVSIFYVTGHVPKSGLPFESCCSMRTDVRQLTRVKDRILKASHRLREEQGLELWDTPKGNFWIPRGNRYALQFNLAEMEERIYGSGEIFVQPGDIVLDCGASNGDFTKEALRAGAKLAVSVEISPQSIECLRRNLKAEIEDGRVVVYPKGVWDWDDMLVLRVSDKNFAADSVVFQPDGSRRMSRFR